MQVGMSKDQGLYDKPLAAVHPGALSAGTLPQYNITGTVQFVDLGLDKKTILKHDLKFNTLMCIELFHSGYGTVECACEIGSTSPARGLANFLNAGRIWLLWIDGAPSI